MEEERGIGNIIFYIILAIIAIVSSIKGKKKQQQQQGAPGGSQPSEQGRSYFPDELFEDDDEEPVRQRGYWADPQRREPEIIVPGRAATIFSHEMEGKNEEPLASMFKGEGVSALDHMETNRRFEELIRENEMHDGFDWDKMEQDDDNVATYNIDMLDRKSVV